MVVGHLRAVEDLLALFQFLAHQWLNKWRIGSDALQDGRTFGIDIVREVGGIDTRIGGELLLIEALNMFQRVVGREGVLLVALHLKGGKVEQARRFCGVEHHIAVDGGENPVFLRLEILYLKIALHYHGQRGGLHTSDAEHLLRFLTKAEGIESRGVHAQQPIANGTTESGLIEALVFFLRLQGSESLADGFFCQR